MVRLVALDVTGALAPLDEALERGWDLPTGFAPPALPGSPPCAFAVSCNLLSQLPLMPLDAIERRAPAIPDDARLAFAQRLAADHLRWLAGLAERAALFSDTESLWMSDGAVVEREDSVWGLPLPAPDSSWLWDIAPARSRILGVICGTASALGSMSLALSTVLPPIARRPVD